MVLLHGANGQGKSNLIEALYLLAIAKSLRASTDKELVRRQSLFGDSHAQVSATVQRRASDTRVQVDFKVAANGLQDGADAPERAAADAFTVQKLVRVNGAPRRASELVGEVNAVMFSAQDLELVYGSPSTRRRYLDILISQLDRQYLRAAQKYQKVVSQRNHLLKLVRDGRSGAGELEFWDDELVESGKYVMYRRAEVVNTLSERIAALYGNLSGDGESLQLIYRPAVDAPTGHGEEALGDALRNTLAAGRPRELAQGHTVSGPHRDDAVVILDGVEAGPYASRGQSRTVVLALKLAEAGILREERGEEPILLLDDVLSELDAGRRAQVLDLVGVYQQCFITTADPALVEERYLSQMARFAVRDGGIEAVRAREG
jgi:DNA replication and repair protein RecF